jgi:CheY-like chemotaxis protein
MSTSVPRPVVLVVDDEPPIRDLARRILEKDGYAVMEAASGPDALKLLADDKHVDLLVADLAMPEISGEELTRQLRSKRPELKVLYVTGHVDRLFVERQILPEGEAFLEKPFTVQGLLEAVSLQLYGTVKRPRFD